LRPSAGLAACRTITATTTDPRKIVTRVRPLARELAIGKKWLEPKHYACDPAQGFGVHLLHEEGDQTLAVFAVAWLPGRGAPAHNHGTWAVVTGVDGPETNILWERLDDRSRPGYAEIVEQTRKVFGAAETVTFLPDSIHSVINEPPTLPSRCTCTASTSTIRSARNSTRRGGSSRNSK
jgi:predicted metal-dependent enzyme (double-stranded beta helix superfamily)